jgi:DNA modification methylase
MPTILFSDILIKPNRQRQEFTPEHMQELKNSIEDLGLMHAPVLRYEGTGWVLVAGERRLRAISEIFELGGSFQYNGQLYEGGMVPFVNIGDLTDLEIEEAELDENLKRRDLSWQEHAAAVERLHNLRVKQRPPKSEQILLAGEVAQVTAPGHTIADTAKEIRGSSEGIHQETTRREIIVARHLSNPAIANAKSADEAFKILKRQEEQTKNIELAKTVGATFNADLHHLLNMDCLSYMETLANSPTTAKFDVICTDPPYGMGADNFGDGAGKLSGIEHHYDDSYASWKKLMTAWAPLSYAVCNPQAHAYVFCDPDNFHELRDLMRAAGWYVFRTPLINYKLNSGRVPLPDQGPRRQYEMILYAIKGKKTVTHIYPDVLSTNSDENLSHGAQKPVAVYQNLLQRSARPGDRLYDPFCGTGPLFEAAHGFKCTAVGTELNPEYFAMSLKRIQRLKALEQPSLI